MAVSVIVPVRDSEQYLEKCIDSIRRQTYEDIEIVLVFDGGYTPEKISEIAASDRRIRCFSSRLKGEKGLLEALRPALAGSAGEYVCFVDSDDRLVPGFVEYMKGLLEDNDCRAGMCAYRIFHWGEDEEYLYNDDEYRVEVIDPDEFLRRSFALRERSYRLFAGKMFERRLVERLPLKNGRIFSDDTELFMPVVLSEGMAVSRLPIYMYNVRSRGIKRNLADETDYMTALEGPLDRARILSEEGNAEVLHGAAELFLMEYLTAYGKLESRGGLDKTAKKELAAKYSEGLDLLKRTRGRGVKDRMNFGRYRLFPGSFTLTEDDFLLDTED